MVPYESQVEISVVSGIIYFKEKSLVKARDDLDFDNGVIGLMKVGAFPTVQWHIFHAYSERDPKARLCVICRIGLRVAIMHRVRLTGSLSFTCQGILMHPSSVALYLFYIIELTFQIIPDVTAFLSFLHIANRGFTVIWFTSKWKTLSLPNCLPTIRVTGIVENLIMKGVVSSRVKIDEEFHEAFISEKHINNFFFLTIYPK